MIANLIAGLALAFSMYTFFRQRSYTENQDKLNKLLLDKELLANQSDKKADLAASFIRVGTKSSYRLKVWNKGRATAKNVTIDFPNGNEIIIESDLKSKFPLETLEPQAGVELLAAVHMGIKPKHTIKLLWDDDVAKGNEKIIHLTL